MTSPLALELPPNWEPMNGEFFKKVELQPNSQEYKDVAQDFLKTAKYNIQKVSMLTKPPTYLYNCLSRYFLNTFFNFHLIRIKQT